MYSYRFANYLTNKHIKSTWVVKSLASTHFTNHLENTDLWISPETRLCELYGFSFYDPFLLDKDQLKDEIASSIYPFYPFDILSFYYINIQKLTHNYVIVWMFWLLLLFLKWASRHRLACTIFFFKAFWGRIPLFTSHLK